MKRMNTQSISYVAAIFIFVFLFHLSFAQGGFDAPANDGTPNIRYSVSLKADITTTTTFGTRTATYKDTYNMQNVVVELEKCRSGRYVSYGCSSLFLSVPGDVGTVPISISGSGTHSGYEYSVSYTKKEYPYKTNDTTLPCPAVSSSYDLAQGFDAVVNIELYPYPAVVNFEWEWYPPPTNNTFLNIDIEHQASEGFWKEKSRLFKEATAERDKIYAEDKNGPEIYSSSRYTCPVSADVAYEGLGGNLYPILGALHDATIQSTGAAKDSFSNTFFNTANGGTRSYQFTTDDLAKYSESASEFLTGGEKIVYTSATVEIKVTCLDNCVIPGGPAGNVTSCKGAGEACGNGADCCSGNCEGGVCKESTGIITCKSNGAGCAAGSECCSGYCGNGICRSSPTTSVVHDGKLMPPIPLSNVTRNVLVWYQWRTLATTSCIRGSSCDASTDCCNAECVGGLCLCGMNACSSSGECCSGYCDKGLCRTAPEMSLFNTPILQGCTGIMEECLPGETSCILICNGLTILLLISALGAGIVSWKRFEHPAAGISAAVIPILLGLMFYVFVGIVSAIAEIAMIVCIRNKSKVIPSEVK